jgi:putative IMPACT (imprinted ancient) family translation regulator
MLQELINKDVEIVVAFGGYTLSGGSTPEKYAGRLLDVNEEFCKLQLLKSKKDIFLATKFIISIKEV